VSVKFQTFPLEGTFSPRKKKGVKRSGWLPLGETISCDETVYTATVYIYGYRGKYSLSFVKIVWWENWVSGATPISDQPK